MRSLFLLLLLSLTITATGWANMASPIERGTQSGSAFSSRNLDVLFEKIRITPDASFSTATIHVEYTIPSPRAGITIPLAFYAMDYENEFTVMLNGMHIQTQQPYDLIWVNDSVKLDFPMLFGVEPGEFGEGLPLLQLGSDFSNNIRPEDLHYFEMELDSGTQVVTVQYTARAWNDRSEWLRKVDFRYSLSPAKYWKKFGAIEVTVDAQAVRQIVKTNLGDPHFGRLDSVATWMFGQMPLETILVGLDAQMPASAQIWVNIGPFGLMLIFSGVLALVHLWLIFRYRRRNPTKKLSWIALVGGLILPFFMLASYMYAHQLIDHAIGEMASRFHGYTFLIMVYYVVVMPVYLIICFLIDILYRARLLGWAK